MHFQTVHRWAQSQPSGFRVAGPGCHSEREVNWGRGCQARSFCWLQPVFSEGFSESSFICQVQINVKFLTNRVLAQWLATGLVRHLQVLMWLAQPRCHYGSRCSSKKSWKIMMTWRFYEWTSSPGHDLALDGPQSFPCLLCEPLRSWM